MMLWLATLGLFTSTLASPLYTRQTSTLPAPGIRGPAPKSEWVAAYEAVKAAGNLPTFAPAKLSDAGNPYYPSGVDTGENGASRFFLERVAFSALRSAACFGNDDISDAPDGMYGVSFDDGPLPSSPALYQFLQKQNQTATHFFIGTNIVNNPDVFRQALASNAHIGVHTWSHPYMTTLNDTQILGELGWTVQAIHDLSDGLIPKFWRPPYGDADNRVRAIAKEVFNLTLVGWNRDSDDWCLNETGGSSCGSYGPKSIDDLENELRSWAVGGVSPGIIGLEHELTSKSVGGFVNTYAGLKQHGWDARCIPDLFNLSWYLNTPGNSQPIDSGVSVGAGLSSLPATSSSILEPALTTSAPSAASTLTSPVAAVESISQTVQHLASSATSRLTFFSFAVPLAFVLAAGLLA
ncbi:hypothetical protein JCM10296v2_001050 [Rhodotorula toruloides]